MALPKLNVIIDADTKGLEKGLTKAQKRMKAFTKLAKMGALAAAAGLALMLKSGLKNIDAQAKLAQSLNTTVKSVQILQRAGDLAGVSLGVIEQASIALTRRLSQAAAEMGGPAVEALDRLGLSAEQLNDIPLDERIEKIQRAIAEFIPAAQQAAVASALFGDRAGVMFARIDAATLRTAREDIRDFGVAISEVDADQIERANDAISRMGLIWTGLVTRLTVNLAPTLEFISDKLAQLWKDMRVVGTLVASTGKIFTEVFGRIGNSSTILLNKMKMTWTGIKTSFLDMVLSLQEGWADFLRSLSEPLRGIKSMEGAFLSLGTAAIMAGTAAIDTRTKIIGLTDSTAALTEENERLAASNAAPLASVHEMLLKVKALTSGLDDGSVSSAEFADNLAAIAEVAAAAGGKGVVGALTAMQERVQAVSDTMKDAMSAGFNSMVDGTKTAADAFKDMARDIIKQLFNILVVQRLVGSFDVGTGKGSGLVGLIMKGLSSFEGGGSTGSGPRSGGLDGKGGKLAILHPQETVIDHTKSGAANMNGGPTTIVNQTINVTAGVAQTVRAEMMGLLPQLKEQTIQAVEDAKRRSVRT